MKREQALDYLRTAVRDGRVAQAYLVEGSPRGVGLDLVQGFLALLLCEGESPGCGRCDGCRRVAARTHPDVLWVEPRKKSRVIGVEQVRELQGRMLQTSLQGGWKAAVLLGADRLGDSGANALLKVLEEPPPRSVFLLVTDAPQFLLPTVVSRCQRLAVGGEEIALPEAWRTRLLDILAGLPEGRCGAAEAVRAAAGLSRLLKEVHEAARSLVEEDLAGPGEEAGGKAEKDAREAMVESRYREYRADLLRAMLAWVRDVMVRAGGGAPELVYYQDRLDNLRRRAARMTARLALENVQVVEDLERGLGRHVPEMLVLQEAVLRLR